MSSCDSLRKSIETLIKCSVKLEANSETICNACQYLHRFGRDFDVNHYDTDLMAATALYLSAKVTEKHLRLRDIIQVFYQTIHNTEKATEMDLKLYMSLKESIIDCELLLLRLLKFKVDTHLPHKYLNIYLQTLIRWMGDDSTAAKLEASCWALLNDYLCGDQRSLNHKPNQIAISIIELSLRLLDYQIPYNDEALLPWNEVFDDRLSKQTIEEICDQIISLFDKSGKHSEDKHSDKKYSPQKLYTYKS